MSMEKALAQLRQETLDESMLFYVKPNKARMYHIFYQSRGTPMRCLCGSYTLTIADVQFRKKNGVLESVDTIMENIPVKVKVPTEEVNAECQHRHESTLELLVKLKKEKLQDELRKMGDDIVDIVRDQVWMYALTLDTEEIHHIVNALEDVVDAQKMRTLQRLKPVEIKALFKSMGGGEP